MGQRSQIYIHYDFVENIGNHEFEHCEGLVARYYQWNYGHMMVSRARYTLEHLDSELACSLYMRHPLYYYDAKHREELGRFCDIDFDTKTIDMSVDIVDEIVKHRYSLLSLFKQDNNDGQLLIDVHHNIGVDDMGIRYAFIASCEDIVPMDAEEYMVWDTDGKWENPSTYSSPGAVEYTQRNIEAIRKMENVRLMTAEEVKTFLEADYSNILGGVPLF